MIRVVELKGNILLFYVVSQFEYKSCLSKTERSENCLRSKE